MVLAVSTVVTGFLLGLAVGVLLVGASAFIALRRSRLGAMGPDGSSTSSQNIARLQSTVDTLPLGVVVTDADGRVVVANRAAHSWAGTHAGVLIDEAIEHHLALAANGGGPTEELLELYGPPKTVVVVRAAPLPGGGAQALVEDISERRRIDAVRTDFVANISHELKTPVGALAVLAETLIEETDPEIVQRLGERLLEEAHRAARTIDDLLELSRIELGGEQLREGVEVAEVVATAVDRGRAIAAQRNIAISSLDIAAEPDGRPVSVTGDRRQLESAVGNLVENAVKYSDAGGQVQVRVRTTGPWVEFMVADQGVGIPARDLDRIFERFYRVDKARSRGTGGSGLGLAIVRHVATNHGGEVLVSSREGEGSTFVLRIPRNPVASNPPAAPPPPTPTGELVVRPGPPERTLGSPQPGHQARRSPSTSSAPDPVASEDHQ